jgi:hypothetical protein
MVGFVSILPLLLHGSFLFRRFRCFPFGSKFGLSRKAFSFPHGHIGGIVQDIGGVRFDFILCHAVTAPGFCKYGHTVKVSVALRLCATAPIQGYNPSVSSKRFRELQVEFFATSTRLQLAQKPEEKLPLLNELQRIVQESKRALVETDSKKC